jgi:radical SAM superfamily enzyme YgiQ (UPF0313 family)
VELPQRSKGDQYAQPGQYRELEAQVRRQVQGQDIPVLFVYAFDPRTRLGPFLYFDKCLLPGAPRAIAAALYAAGLTNVRVVLQSWNPGLQPSEARFDGRPPEMLLISSMQIHGASAYELIRDAWKLGDDRPLILAGGPKAIYEPWDFFGLSPDGREGADVVVTGEEFVLLELLDRILEYLVNTGTQRLVCDLDELPMPFDALGLFEPPHRNRTLSGRPLAQEQLSRYLRIVSILSTRGCRFRCEYCPIPAYNQFTYRCRSPERLVEEMAGITTQSGVKTFFGADDNLFNDRELVERIFDTMARGTVRDVPFRDAIVFGTEATEFDVFRHQDLLPLARDAGLRSLWLGIEDLTGNLVKKGQSPEKTKTVFRMLLKQGIAPMPMMIHHDGQPLWTWRGLYGLINQIRFLRRVGALTCQITMLTPSVGSKLYEQLFAEGLVLSRVGGKPVEEYQFDGNHCVATASSHPWTRQLNIFAAYAAFYNPVNLLRALPKFDKLWAQRMRCQILGMLGVARSLQETGGWIRRMITGPIERFTEPPRPVYPMVGPPELGT